MTRTLAGLHHTLWETFQSLCYIAGFASFLPSEHQPCLSTTMSWLESGFIDKILCVGVSSMWSRVLGFFRYSQHGGPNIDGSPSYSRRCLGVVGFHEDVEARIWIPRKLSLVFSRHPVCIPHPWGPAMNGSSAPIVGEGLPMCKRTNTIQYQSKYSAAGCL